MLELNQFRHCPFCLKVRMVLQAKGLHYREIEVKPGIGQLEIFRISGQRQVPVLVDGEKVIADSSNIIRHLEDRNPIPTLLPKDPKKFAQVSLIEDWADTTLASAVREYFVQTIAIDQNLRMAFLAEDLPAFSLQLFDVLPSGLVRGVGGLLSKKEGRESFLRNLEAISRLIESSSWIVGDSMSLADFAVAAQLSLLRFPASLGSNLSGMGVPGFSDHPSLKSLFDWRDQFELELLSK